MLRSGDGLQPGEAAPARASARRGILLTLVFGVLAGGVVYGVGLATAQSRRLGTALVGGEPLPDGSVVRVEQVTFGRKHRLGPPPTRFPWLPAWLLGSDPNEPVIEVGTSRDVLTLWISQRHPSAPRRTLGLEWWTDYQLTDSHGCRFDDTSRERRTQSRNSSSSSSIGRGDRFSPLSPSDPPGLTVGAMDHEAFPRREAEMTLKLLGPEGAKAAEFKVTNPAPGPYPEWKPLTLPQTRRDGDLSVVLEKVEGVIDTWKMNGSEDRQQSLQPSFRISQNGKRTNRWRADDLRVSDATGNQDYAYSTRLCVREKAWKLRARFWRTPEAAFSPDEIWEVRDIPVQKPGTILALSGSATLHKVKLDLLGIGGRGSFQYKDGVPAVGEHPLPATASASEMNTSGSTSSGANGRHTESSLRAGEPHVGVRVTDLPEEYHLSLLAIDNRGRRIPSEISASMDTERYLGLDLPNDSRTLTLRFMVHRCRTVEFLIRPPQFKHRHRG